MRIDSSISLMGQHYIYWRIRLTVCVNTFRHRYLKWIDTQNNLSVPGSLCYAVIGTRSVCVCARVCVKTEQERERDQKRERGAIIPKFCKVGLCHS